MLQNSLKAISEMLNQDQEIPADKYIIKAQCANTFLKEVIKSLDSKLPNICGDDCAVEVSKKELIPEHNKYQVIVGTDRTIKDIKNLPKDAFLKLDGVQMTHAEAIGKTFKEVTIL
jgi:hypothetical protein